MIYVNEDYFMKQKVAEWINVTFGLRKFIAWFGLFVVGIVFRVKGQINGNEFVDLMKSTFAGFVAGNTVEHLISFGKDFVTKKAAAPTDGDLITPDEIDDAPEASKS